MKNNKLAIGFLFVVFVLPLTATLGIHLAIAKKNEKKVLWDSWYTITTSNSIHYSYYNERGVIKMLDLPGGIQIETVEVTNKTWTRDEGFINTEVLISSSYNDPEITPLSFIYQSVYRNQRTKISGSADAARAMAIKVTEKDQTRRVKAKRLRKDTIYAALFPLYLAKKELHKMKTKDTFSFSALIEGDMQTNFKPIVGRVKILEKDDFAQKSKTSKIHVDFNKAKSTWWVDQQGQVVMAEYPAQNMVIRRVSKDEAQSFFKRQKKSK